MPLFRAVVVLTSGALFGVGFPSLGKIWGSLPIDGIKWDIMENCGASINEPGIICNVLVLILFLVRRIAANEEKAAEGEAND